MPVCPLFRCPAAVFTCRPGRGFTLVEATVTLAIAALLALLAWPSVATLVDHRRLDGAARALAADLQFARFEAIGRSEAVLLTALPDEGCYLVHTGPASDCDCARGCRGAALRLKQVDQPAHERIRIASPAGSLRFDPHLGTCTPAGTLQVTGPGGLAVHQVVNVMGRVRSCSPDARVPGHVAC